MPKHMPHRRPSPACHTFGAPFSHQSVTLRPPSTFESRGTDGSVVRTFELHQVEPFLRWLLSLEGEVEVLEPVELRDELVSWLRELV